MPEVPSPASPTAYSRDQLSGRACIHNGCTSTDLATIGYVYTEGTEGLLPWALVACPEHRQEST